MAIQDQINDASTDLANISTVANGAADEGGSGIVTMRLGREVPTMARALGLLTAEPFATYALATATAPYAGGYFQVGPNDTGTHPSVTGDIGGDGTNTPNEGFFKAADDLSAWVRLGGSVVGAASESAVTAQTAATAAQGYRDDTLTALSNLNYAASTVALLASLGFSGADWSVSANAFEALAASPAAQIGKPVKVVRQGFDANASPVIYTDTLYATAQVALPYPSSTSMTTPAFSSTTDALSDQIYSTDAVVPYAVNSADIVSPVPVAVWTMPSRLVVGNSINWEIAAFHRDGRNRRMVACVRVRARNTADTTQVTPWQTVSTTVVSTLCEDVNPIEVFAGALDVSSLPDNTVVQLEAEVYPWIGTTASVLSTSGVTDPRKFGPRHFTRNTTRAANPPKVYVSPTGNDTSGVCSLDDATAAATPCLTLQGALSKLSSTTAVTDGLMDGCIVYIAGTVAIGSTPVADRNHVSGAVIVQRASGTARSAAVIQQAAAIGLRLGSTATINPYVTGAALILKDVSWQRTAAGQIGLSNSLPAAIQLWNVNFDNGSVAGAWPGSNAASTFRTFGCTFTNYNNNFAYTTNLVQPLFRGLNCPTATPEGVAIIGSYVAGAAGTLAPENGLVFYGNKVTELSTSGGAINWSATSAGQNITGVVIWQNLFERRDASSQLTLRVSGDNANGNVIGAVIGHNVSTGTGLTGRWNLFYDESTGTNRRTHRLNRVIGNIVGQLNTKSSIFVALNQSNPSEAPNRLGNWAFAHGAGAWGNFSMFRTEQPSTESQYYPGLGSNISTSDSVRNDPLFVNYAGTGNTGATATVGAGGGDYHLQSGSPAHGIVPYAMCGFDYAGTARSSGVQDAGLYA